MGSLAVFSVVLQPANRLQNGRAGRGAPNDNDSSPANCGSEILLKL